jgi:hypothetical protein
LRVGVVESFTTVSPSLSPGSWDAPWKLVYDVVLRSLMLRCELWKGWIVVGFRGSGRANDVFLLGIMIGSSSVDEESSSDESHCCCRGATEYELCRLTALGNGSSTTTTVVSTRARPLESIVNFACVLICGPDASGIEERLDKR